jgi:hypothetical protein
LTQPDAKSFAARDIEDLPRKGILARGGRTTSYSAVASVADALEAVARRTLAHTEKAVWQEPELTH